MTTMSFINAAPLVLDLGTQDLSIETLPREPEAIPQHLPKFYLFTQKPRKTAQLVVGAEREKMFGKATFDLRSKYANHATVFANLANAEGNVCMIESVFPEDAGPEADITMWLDVLPTQVDIYQRNPDGSILYNALNEPTVTGQAAGYKVKWVVSHSADAEDAAKFGSRAPIVGDQVDTATSTQSTRYPIFETKCSYLGSDGNNNGFRFWAPTQATNAMPTALMEQEKVYPYFIQMIRRDSANVSPTVVDTVDGDREVMFTFRPDIINPATDGRVSMQDVVLQSYQNLTDQTYPTVYGDFDKLAVYSDQIDYLTALFHEAEIPYLLDTSDFTDEPETHGLFNIVSGMSSAGIPYTTYHFVDDLSSVRPTIFSNLYAFGGSDGIMNDTVFADLVSKKMAEYADSNSPIQDLATNVESIFYDSGFPIKTKYDLCQFVSQRKDTFVVLSTHVVDGPVLSASEEHSLAISLRTHLQLYPESDYFGTPVMRGMIMGRSGLLRNSQFTKRLPLSAELLIKSARYMGASDGAWKNKKSFDGAPGSVIDNMYDISITWIPATVRNKHWDVGLNWVQPYTRKSYFFPAFKTIYNDDTSVLNSYFTALAIAYLNKVAHAAWREYSGVSNLTPAQLIERVNNFVVDRVRNKHDGRFVIIPDALVTDNDVKRGFSWTLPIKIYAPNMVTAMTTYVKAYRIGALNTEG